MIRTVRTFKADTVHMGRLEKGADIIQSMERYCLEQGIQAGWVNVIGALDRATISYYDQRAQVYHHQPMSGEYEIVSCSGNISLKDGKPFAHLHIVLSDTDFQSLGGHLWPGSSAIFAAEFVLYAFSQPQPDEWLTRCPDTQTGLALW